MLKTTGYFVDPKTGTEAPIVAHGVRNGTKLRPVSTLEITKIARALPLYNERMIYEVAMQFVAIRNGDQK